MKKSMKELWLLWKKQVDWDKKTLKQKLIAAWFSLSFPIAAICGGTILAVAGILNLAASAYYCVKYVPVREED